MRKSGFVHFRMKRKLMKHARRNGKMKVNIPVKKNEKRTVKSKVK